MVGFTLGPEAKLECHIALVGPGPETKVPRVVDLVGQVISGSRSASQANEQDN